MNPTPKYIQEALKKGETNFSLVFPREVNWIRGTKKDSRADTVSVNENAVSTLCEKAGKLLPKASSVLKKVHDLQSEYLKTVANKYEIKGTLITPFITGLGAGHPTETGMILDRNTGVPYIPASSIKGVLRTAFAISIADEKGIADDGKIQDIFGSDDKGVHGASRAKIIILDAYPENIPTIQNDILNPHYGKYYEGKKPLPTETDNPIPVNFLSVKPGCTFVFRYILTDVTLNAAIEKAFGIAFEKVGFGGKTSLGYGRFEDAFLKRKQAEAEKVAKQKQEAEKLQEELGDSVLDFEKKNKAVAEVVSSKPLTVKVTYINKKDKSQKTEPIPATGFSNLVPGTKVVVSAKEWSNKKGNITMLFVEKPLEVI